MNSFAVVEQFEQSVAKFAGSKHAVAVNTCTNAIFLSVRYVTTQIVHRGGPVVIPARTFISVPMAIIHAGQKVEFDPEPWRGTYQLKPFPIIDSALRFSRGMYDGGLHCLSFHARKLLNIGEGGMILTDDGPAAEWLRKARYSGRDVKNGYRIEDIEMLRTETSAWSDFSNEKQRGVD